MPKARIAAPAGKADPASPAVQPAIGPELRQRRHAERMLARAERRSRQAAKLVSKWKARLLELDREGIAARQARLWEDEQAEGERTDDSLPPHRG